METFFVLIFVLPFILVPILIFAFFIFIIVKIVSQWSYNNSQPVLSREAKVVTKRTQISGGSENFGSSTYFFVTFQFENGERLEFGVVGEEYGMLCEGDMGTLTYQGARYLKFNRKIEATR